MLAGHSVNNQILSEKFHKFHTNIDVTSFSIKSIDKTMMINIILSLNPSKAVDPTSIPIQILKLFINGK